MHELATWPMRDEHRAVSTSAAHVLECIVQVAHLVELGINAVELLPVFEFDELEFQRIPNPRDHMVNIWGYSHISFFAPMSRYAADGAGPIAAANEFKQMVRELHKAGIEVILDVVYNHTAEGTLCAGALPCSLFTCRQRWDTYLLLMYLLRLLRRVYLVWTVLLSSLGLSQA